MTPTPPSAAEQADRPSIESAFDQAALEAYLSQLHGATAVIDETLLLGGERRGAAALKAFGYGQPLRLIYRVSDQPHEAVLRRVSRNGFGRELVADRVAAVWLDFDTFNKLPAHAAALDRLGLTADGRLESTADLADLLLLTEYVPGRPYADDLVRIRDQGGLAEVDLARAAELARYLAGIHRQKHADPLLWRRRLRDLIGHGEGIMGLADSYPEEYQLVSAADLQEIERLANQWRWQLKPLARRLSQVHGDFHPFNVLYDDAGNFRLIDRSRGEWGEPADDVSCLTINYLFFSLQCADQLVDPFEALYRTFWQTYLAESQDQEIVQVIQPWYAWRALVLASPQWYPTLADETRLKLITFARQIMLAAPFNWPALNDYLEI